MYICTQLCVYVCMYVCMYVYIYIYIYTCMYAYIHVHELFGPKRAFSTSGRALSLRPVHLLRVFLLRVLESNFPGDPYEIIQT